MLRRTLGLSSDNQVRNRIERIKDLLSEHIRRGPNNQIFLTNPGLELMKQFQELHDTGLTLAEASQVIRATLDIKAPLPYEVSSRYPLNSTKPDPTASDLASALQKEMTLIRTHITALHKQLPSSLDNEPLSDEVQPWWIYLREDVDVT
jgi:hypothetical protein